LLDALNIRLSKCARSCAKWASTFPSSATQN
jgi:hypothetical protein